MNRAQMIYALDDAITMVKDSSDKVGEPIYFIPSVDDITDDEKAENEYSKLGFFISFHPLDNFRIRLTELTAIQDLEEKSTGESVALGGLMMDAQEKITKAGKKMGVFTLEDLTGRVEVVVFGKAFEQYAHLFKKKNPAIQVIGKLDIQVREMDEGEEIRTPKIILSKMSELQEASKIYKITLNLTKRDNIHSIYNLLTNNPGDIKISLEYEHVIFDLPLSFNQDREALRALGHLCHYESTIDPKG
jgi:DNA polymerase-3 subunit alpha